MTVRVLGLIPARGGSKGVPRKNIRQLGDRPLLAYTAESALDAATLSRVVLSTDDAEIAAVGRSCGLDVPFLRPAALAEDSTPSLDVILHALDALTVGGDDFDAVCLLQPTSPFRRAGLIDDCVTALRFRRTDSVITIAPIPAEYHPRWAYSKNDDGAVELMCGGSNPIPRRQDLPSAFYREGSVYVTRTATVRAGSMYGERCHGIVVQPTVNIDSPDDWARAEALVGEIG